MKGATDRKRGEEGQIWFVVFCHIVVMFKVRALNVCLFPTSHMIDNVYSMLRIEITDKSQT